jgi:hypothetical protein
MSDNYLKLRVIYVDLPDLVELAIEVQHDGWSANSTAYASPVFLTQDPSALLRWSRSPERPHRMEAGMDTGIGWLAIEFTSDIRGHVRCHIQMSSGAAKAEPRWRMALVLSSELGLVERFAHECTALGAKFSGEAVLTGLHT